MFLCALDTFPHWFFFPSIHVSKTIIHVPIPEVCEVRALVTLEKKLALHSIHTLTGLEESLKGFVLHALSFVTELFRSSGHLPPSLLLLLAGLLLRQ